MNEFTAFTEYEENALAEMVQREARPGYTRKALALVGKPVGKMLERARESDSAIVRRVSHGVDNGIARGLMQSIRMANGLINHEGVLARFAKQGIAVGGVDDIRKLRLEDMDAAARTYSAASAFMVTVEGFVMGVGVSLGEIIPFAQVAVPAMVAADVAASVTLLSRNACQVASCYGYSPAAPENMPHILMSLVPERQSSDEGYIAAKAVVVRAAREAGEFMARNAGRALTKELLEKEAPQLVRLIAMVSERLGIALTEKSLGTLIPVAGGLLNGGLNLAFQQTGHLMAMDYFRRITLEQRHGEQAVRARLYAHAARLSGNPA